MHVSKRMAGNTERSFDVNSQSFDRDSVAGNRKFRGYGWFATLELLSPPIRKPVDSRKTIELTICPSCNSVHELGGRCISRHNSSTPAMAAKTARRGLFFQPRFFYSPLLGSMVMGNDNPLELNARVVQQLTALNLIPATRNTREHARKTEEYIEGASNVVLAA